MAGSVRILLFGNDSLLLKSRRWVLENSGYEVYAATSFLALNHVLANHPASLPIDVLILCHSLSAAQCKRARAIALADFPNVKVVILAVNRSIAHSADGDNVVDTADGPEILLEAVGDLVKMPPERWAASSGRMPRSKFSV